MTGKGFRTRERDLTSRQAKVFRWKVFKLDDPLGQQDQAHVVCCGLSMAKVFGNDVGTLVVIIAVSYLFCKYVAEELLAGREGTCQFVQRHSELETSFKRESRLVVAVLVALFLN